MLVLALWAGVVCVPAGCSDARARRASKNILQEMEKAQRQYGQALSLMAGTPYKVRGEFAPLEQVATINSDQIEPVAPEPMNPKALAVLDSAEKAMETALRENDAAEQSVKDLGYAMLGRISVLKGQYHEAGASAVRDKAHRALAQAEPKIASMRAQTGLLAYYEQLAAASDDDVRTLLSSASSDASRLDQQAAAIRAETATLKETVKQLEELNGQLTAEARSFRIESRVATGDKSLELFDKFQAKQVEANRNEYKIAAAEERIAALARELELVELEASAAKGRTKVAEELLKRRTARRDFGLQERQAIVGSLGKARRSVEEFLDSAAEACGGARKVEADAVGAYQRAAERFARLRAPQGGSPAGDPEMLAQQAAALMAEARVHVSRLQLQDHNDRIVKDVSKLWPSIQPTTQPATQSTQPALPASLAMLGSYMASPEQVRQQAQDKLQQAVELYETAIGRSRRGGQVWLYEEGLTTAKSALERLSQGR